jgi:hypothetical protein
LPIILKFIIIKQIPYQKYTVVNIRYAVEQLVFIFHNTQLHIINLLPIIPLYTIACSSVQIKEGQTTELPLPVHSYITVCSRRRIKIHAVSKCIVWYDMIYLLAAIGLKTGGSSTVHIYTQIVHRTTKKRTIHRTKQKIHRTTKKQYIEQHKNKLEQCGPCPFLVSYILAFALQLRKQ